MSFATESRPETSVPTRVLLIDDHTMFAETVARVLSADPTIEIVAVASTVEDGVRRATETRPDVAIVDFQLPDGDGADATRQIRITSPQTRVVVVTGGSDQRALVESIDAGCSAFVTKDRALSELVQAVRLAAAGEAYVHPSLLATLLPHFGRESHGVGNDLTKREREILTLIGEGLTNKAIAARLTVSVHTIRNHVQNLLVKLDAHSKLEAVAIAAREGLLT